MGDRAEDRDRRSASRLAGLLRGPGLAIVAAAALAAALRTVTLAHPPGFVFDEIYYAKAGCILVGFDDRTCRLDATERLFREQRWDVGSYVHPDLGKWQIGLGVKAFGMRPFGWRISSAIAGTLVVALTAATAWLLFRSAVWTAVAGGLLAIDGMNLVLSRIALLDVHLELWVTAGFLALLLDRRRLERARRTPDAERSVAPLLRPWLLVAGVAFGAATAVKWSGAFALGAAGVLVLAWATGRHGPGLGRGRALARALAREGLPIVVGLGLVPLLVYLLTWWPWLHHMGHDPVREPVAAAAALAREHLDMWRYQAETIREFEEVDGTRTPTHPYYSRPWRWPVLGRPVLFYSELDDGTVSQILAIGNPAIAWASVPALVACAVLWWRARDRAAGFLVLAFLGQWLPWFLVPRPQFSFYLLPMTPYLVLAVVLALRRLADARIVVRDAEGLVATNPETGGPAVSRARPYRPFVVAYLAIAAALTVWFWPVLVARTISEDRWRAIVWFRAWI
ncbi:MAG: hypothetical protein KatS3mg013_1842 [Actinomycetota bacterium]|jgi:dolichyl-phosphate-mannose-protein mannosyltransferase|nr:MAG: hypothetical protein KatS3mg013_1842 [Actinomycetota bacterium]